MNSARFDPEAFQRSFDQIATTLPARVGIAVAPVGRGGAVGAGPWRSGPAWSTSKIPLAIAATRHDPQQAKTARQAIIASDNESAERLWASLGSPAEAARATSAVIAELGGGRVEVQSRKVRPEFSSFGQTDWSLTSQADFTARLPCSRDVGEIPRLMGQVDSGQQWGLAAAGSGAPVKGGWGPRPDGGYQVRQLGILDTGHGQVAVALAAEPSSGAYADGSRVLTTMADWLKRQPNLPTGGC